MLCHLATTLKCQGKEKKALSNALGKKSQGRTKDSKICPRLLRATHSEYSCARGREGKVSVILQYWRLR